MIVNIPIRRVENDPFITGFDNIKIATTFPKTPSSETIDKNTPSMMNVNILVFYIFTFPFLFTIC